MTLMLYFAYGSNLDEAQMRARCPGARRVARAVLPHHALHFGNWSERWQGSVASVRRSSGSARFADMQVSQPGAETLRL